MQSTSEESDTQTPRTLIGKKTIPILQESSYGQPSTSTPKPSTSSEKRPRFSSAEASPKTLIQQVLSEKVKRKSPPYPLKKTTQEPSLEDEELSAHSQIKKKTVSTSNLPSITQIKKCTARKSIVPQTPLNSSQPAPGGASSSQSAVVRKLQARTPTLRRFSFKTGHWSQQTLSETFRRPSTSRVEESLQPGPSTSSAPDSTAVRSPARSSGPRKMRSKSTPSPMEGSLQPRPSTSSAPDFTAVRSPARSSGPGKIRSKTTSSKKESRKSISPSSRRPLRLSRESDSEASTSASSPTELHAETSESDEEAKKETPSTKKQRKTIPKKRLSGAPAKESESKPEECIPRMPKSITWSNFQRFAGIRVTKEVLPLLEQACDEFFKQTFQTLSAFANHAGRSSIQCEDAILLLRRVRCITENQSLESLAERYLPREYREEFIPTARAYGTVVPSRPLPD